MSKHYLKPIHYIYSNRSHCRVGLFNNVPLISLYLLTAVLLQINVEPNHTTLAGHPFEHDIAFAAA